MTGSVPVGLSGGGPIATGLGSVPGDDFLQLTEIILGELEEPHLPFFPILPERGVFAEPLARTASLLPGLPIELQSYGWRLTHSTGKDLRRAQQLLSSDINMLADFLGSQEISLPQLSMSILGPVSLATGIYLPRGERALADAGARRDIAESLAIGLADFLAAIQRAAPMTELSVLIDERQAAPGLQGIVPSVSGYQRLPAIPHEEARHAWGQLIQATQAIAAVTEVVFAAPRVSVNQEAVLQQQEISFDGLVAVAVPNQAILTPRQAENFAEEFAKDRRVTFVVSEIATDSTRILGQAEVFWQAWRDAGLSQGELQLLRLALPERIQGVKSPSEYAAALKALRRLTEAINGLALDCQ